MKRYLSKKSALVVAALAVAGILVGVAVAAWTASGSGSGSASATTASNLTISPGTPSTALFPTGSADVAATIANPNKYKVHVSQINLGAVTVDAAHSGCNVSSVSVTSPQTNGGSGWDIAADGGSVNVSLANAVSMTNGANDACQGATFSVALTLTGASTN